MKWNVLGMTKDRLPSCPAESGSVPETGKEEMGFV